MTVELRSGDARLTVAPEDGGRWTSLRVGDLELLTSQEMSDADPATLSGCFPMAPYAGRVRDASLTWRGRTYALPPSAPPHAIHGLVHDQAWQVVRSDAGSVGLDVALGPRWPFAGRVRQELALHPDRLEADLVVTAEQDMPVWVGYHPWFARRLARGAAVRLEVPATRQWVRGPDGLPTGQVTALGPGPYDDCLEGLDGPPRLVWPGALALELQAATDTWVVFDERPGAVCVEPQTAPPDAFGLGLARELGAGQELALRLVLAWSPA